MRRVQISQNKFIERDKKMEIESYRRDGYLVTISFDETAESPRRWDRFGTILHLRSRYNLGDEVATREQIEEIVNDENNICLPVYAYIHGGIIIKTKPFSCPWDSGQCGIIFCTKEQCEKEGLTEDKAKSLLASEISEFSQYLMGNVYRFSIKKIIKCDSCGHERFETQESCGGYYDMDYLKEEIKAWFECVKNETH